MRFRKTRILVYTLVLISTIVFLPAHLMLLLRDGWILIEKNGYQLHDATVTNAEVKKGAGSRARKMVEVVLKDGSPVSSGEPRLVLSRHDFESPPKKGDRVKVWINRATAEVSVQGEPVARVGGWYFQRMSVGRVARHVGILLVLIGVVVGCLRRIGRLTKSEV